MAKRVILDTDIGTDVDDAMALLLALASPELEVVGVTTVHADAPLRARLARKLLALAGRKDVPVVAGASLPLADPLPPNFHWHPRLRGHEGVGVLSAEELIPSPELHAGADDAAHFIMEQAGLRPGELSLVTIGSLTNVGRALQLEPRLAEWIRDVTLMGGTVYAERFPWPPMLETNLNCDPEATRLVFESGMPLTVVPMEVTTQVFLTAEQRAHLAALGAPLADALVTMMEGMLVGMDSLSSEVGLSEDFYQGRTFMHDPLAVAAAFGSPLVTVERLHVKYEVIEQVVRIMPHAHLEGNLNVAVGVDALAFVDFWLDRVETFAGGSARERTP